MSSSTQLDNEINKYQDDFINNLRQIERQELEAALNEAEKSEKRLYNICTCIFCIGSAAILFGWYAHYNLGFNP